MVRVHGWPRTSRVDRMIGGRSSTLPTLIPNYHCPLLSGNAALIAKIAQELRARSSLLVVEVVKPNCCIIQAKRVLVNKTLSRIETMNNEGARPKEEQVPFPNNASTHPNFSSPKTRLVAAQYYYCCAFSFFPSKSSTSSLLDQLLSTPSVLNRFLS